MLVLPSDHLIGDGAAFHRAVAVDAEAARSGRIVTRGIRPTRAETGYGCIELPEPLAPQVGEQAGGQAVAMRDAVLVASMDRAQDVRLAVSALQAEGAGQG